MQLSRKSWLMIALAVMSMMTFAVYNSTRKGLEVSGYVLKKKDLLISVTGTSTGTFKADKEVKLTAQRIGRIAKLFVEEGAVVKAGGSIAELEADEMQQRLLLASAVMARMQAQLDSLKAGLIAFRADIEATINKAKAVLDETETRLRRYQELKDKGYISQGDLDIVKREYDVAKASFSAAEAARRQIQAREEEIRAQAASLEQSKREYNLSKIMLDYSYIQTPIAGVVTSRPVKLAETMPVGGLIASVVAPESLYIEAFIDEADAAKIAVGQQVNVTMDAFPERTFRGEVSLLSPVVLGNKQEARTFEARVRLQDKSVVPKPGMSADVEVIVSKKEMALIVPSQAIIEKNDVRYVYLCRKNRAELRKVKTGLFNWSYTEVLEGLQEGDMVIANPDLAGLADGVRIHAVVSDK